MSQVVSEHHEGTKPYSIFQINFSLIETRFVGFMEGYEPSEYFKSISVCRFNVKWKV